jgi:hypothetical protein
MFGSRFAAQRLKGLRKYIIWSSAGSVSLWVAAQSKLRSTLPHEVQDVLGKCEREGRTESPEYEEAVGEYYSQFLCRIDPMSADISAGFQCIGEDPTVYGSM